MLLCLKKLTLNTRKLMMSFAFSHKNNIYPVLFSLLIFFSTYGESASFSFCSVIDSLNNFTPKLISNL